MIIPAGTMKRIILSTYPKPPRRRLSGDSWRGLFIRYLQCSHTCSSSLQKLKGLPLKQPGIKIYKDGRKVQGLLHRGMATIRSFWSHLISPASARTTKKITEDYQVKQLGFQLSNFQNICSLIKVLYNYTQMKNSLNETVFSDPDPYITAT